MSDDRLPDTDPKDATKFVAIAPGGGFCDHDGGRGIGAGHVCRCARRARHSLIEDRPHGCTCGAMW